MTPFQRSGNNFYTCAAELDAKIKKSNFDRDCNDQKLLCVPDLQLRCHMKNRHRPILRLERRVLLCTRVQADSTPKSHNLKYVYARAF